jgi:3-deoxy-D-manno-octulosonic-acid transferase
VKLGAAVLHGPHVHNFAEIYAAIDGVDGAPTIVDAAGLADAVGTYLAEPAARDRYVDDTAAALASFGGALDKTLSALGPYLAGGRE